MKAATADIKGRRSMNDQQGSRHVSELVLISSHAASNLPLACNFKVALRRKYVKKELSEKHLQNRTRLLIIFQVNLWAPGNVVTG